MSQRKTASETEPAASPTPPGNNGGSLRMRREHRVDLDIEGPTLRQPGGAAAAIKLHNLSAHGFRTEWPYKLRRGDRVWLKISGIEALPAIIAWEKGFTIGCKFEAPLHPAVLARIVSALKPA